MHAPPVVVFGAGRSGTTWLAEIIAAAGLELIFEPLNELEVSEAARFRKQVRFLDETDMTAEWEPLFLKILRGEIRNGWTLRAGTRGERKVVKLIRANLVIKWMISRFELAPVFVIRNPLAVAYSLRTEGWEIPDSWVRWMIADKRLSRRYLSPLDDLLGRSLGSLEIFSLYWCIQNVVPKQQGLFSRIPVVQFEDLCRDPEGVIISLAPRLGIEITEAVREACHRWSIMKSQRAAQPGYDPATAWRTSLSAKEVAIVTGIVERFGLEEYLPR